MGILAGRFPDDIAAGAIGGHMHWQITRVDHQGGFETPNLDWQDARGEWNVARAIEEGGLHEIARGHYAKTRGGFHYFRFKDYSDFEVERDNTVEYGRLTGSTTAWQINKVYGGDEPDFEYVRPLKRIVAGTLQIWKNNALQTETTHYTVDLDTGIVTSLTSWAGATLEVACEFDVLCRYDTPQLRARLVHRNSRNVNLLQWDDIDIVEVREGQVA